MKCVQFCSRRRHSVRHWKLATALAAVALATASGAQPLSGALVRHAPSFNGGTVEGNLQQNLGESVTLNGGAVITGDLLVPGIATVVQSGNPTFGGTIVGSGNATPTNYQVILNGNARLDHLRTRIDAIPFPSVSIPPPPEGTRNVVLSLANKDAGDFATLRNLTLSGSAGQVAIPAGTYGDFKAEGASGFTMGTEGAGQPAVYNLQHLDLKGNSQIVVKGPVVLNVANGFACAGTMNGGRNPLILNISSGGLTLNGEGKVYAVVNAPKGTVIVNSNSQLIGALTCDRLSVNGNGLLRVQSLTEATDHPPAASAQAPSLRLADTTNLPDVASQMRIR